jgi:hypothetical protein
MSGNEPPHLVPHEIIAVKHIPKCDFCHDRYDIPGPYDFKTRMGPWAHGCPQHWLEFRAYPELGQGKGQLWISEKEYEAHEEHVGRTFAEDKPPLESERKGPDSYESPFMFEIIGIVFVDLDPEPGSPELN